MAYRLLVFLFLNFAALGFGGLLMGEGPSSDWYQNVNKAPWTPPGWVFGLAWTCIMICFAIYMSYAWELTGNKKTLVALFTLQWILNVSWNPVFFRYHLTLGGLVIIAALTVVVGYFLFSQLQRLNFRSILILPYFLWLLVATSLNAFIHLKN